MAKLVTQRAAFELMDACLQIHGGAGYMREYWVERAARDARLGPIGGGSDEIMREILGRVLALCRVQADAQYASCVQSCALPLRSTRDAPYVQHGGFVRPASHMRPVRRADISHGRATPRARRFLAARPRRVGAMLPARTAQRPTPRAPSARAAPAAAGRSAPRSPAAPAAALRHQPRANIGAVRAAVLCLVNRERAAHGERALMPERQLTAAAQAHTDSMASRGLLRTRRTAAAKRRSCACAPPATCRAPTIGYEVGENIGWGTLWLARPARSSPPGWPPRAPRQHPRRPLPRHRRSASPPHPPSRAGPPPAGRHLHAGLRRRHQRLTRPRLRRG